MKKPLFLLAILFACKTTQKTPYYSNPSALFDKEKFAKNRRDGIFTFMMQKDLPIVLDLNLSTLLLLRQLSKKPIQ